MSILHAIKSLNAMQAKHFILRVGSNFSMGATVMTWIGMPFLKALLKWFELGFCEAHTFMTYIVKSHSVCSVLMRHSPCKVIYKRWAANTLTWDMLSLLS